MKQKAIKIVKAYYDLVVLALLVGGVVFLGSIALDMDTIAGVIEPDNITIIYE